MHKHNARPMPGNTKETRFSGAVKLTALVLSYTLVTLSASPAMAEDGVSESVIRVGGVTLDYLNTKRDSIQRRQGERPASRVRSLE